MTPRTSAIALLSAILMAAAPAAAFGQDGDVAAVESSAPDSVAVEPPPYIVCIDDVCRVTDDPRSDEPTATDVESSTAPLVCLEGKGECSVADPAISIEELVASAGGRLVYGAVDADPSGVWRITSLPTRVRCTIAGAGPSSVKVTRTKARGSIERQADGRLIARSARAGEPPFEWVPMGPGLYGSIQTFSEANVSGVIVSYYGMLTEDRVNVTALVTSTLSDGGPKTDCIMKRNLNMKRISGPTLADPTSVPSDPAEAAEADTSE